MYKISLLAFAIWAVILCIAYLSGVDFNPNHYFDLTILYYVLLIIVTLKNPYE